MDQPDYSQDTPTPVTIAGIWRRLGAFIIDITILGLAGVLAGCVLYNQFAVLGPWGQVLGFAIALAYFGTSQSHIGGGQSPGMKVLGLKVVTSDGTMLSVRASFTRAAIFCIAYFLNGLTAYIIPLSGWLASGVSLLLFGVSFCMLYLLIFNRRTRQSLHDLAVAAFVVKAADRPPVSLTLRIWRGHVVIAAALAVTLCVAATLWALPNVSRDPYLAMEKVRIAVTGLPGVSTAAISLSYQSLNGGDFNRLMVNATVNDATVDHEALARRIAKIALENYAGADRMQTLAVTLSSGYNIGIAQSWRSTNYVHSPQDWRKANPPPPTPR